MNKSGYEVYLDDCLLPVAPKKIAMKIGNANETMTLINEGEINLIRTAKLTDIEFECLLPQVKYPFAAYDSGFESADYYLEYFEELKIEKKPFQFIVSRSLPGNDFDTDLTVSMEDYQIIEDAGEGFDITVKIKLKQYRSYRTKTVTIKQEAGAETTAAVNESRETASAPPPPRTYSVVRGDCLWNIAKKFYGSGSKYTVIYDANRAVIGGNPNLIYPGQVLTIPEA
jgi:hypothetical protein